MYKDLKFPILIVHRDIKADSVAGSRRAGGAGRHRGADALSAASAAFVAFAIRPCSV